jgi:hypothetical protein
LTYAKFALAAADKERGRLLFIGAVLFTLSFILHFAATFPSK